jgi:hypothetical protein
LASPHAKEYNAATRLYGLVEGDLMYTMDMAAVGEPMTPTSRPNSSASADRRLSGVKPTSQCRYPSGKGCPHRTNPGEPVAWVWPIAIGVAFLIAGLVRRRSA